MLKVVSFLFRVTLMALCHGSPMGRMMVSLSFLQYSCVALNVGAEALIAGVRSTDRSAHLLGAHPELRPRAVPQRAAFRAASPYLTQSTVYYTVTSKRLCLQVRRE